MTDQFCLNYRARRQQNLNTELLLANINGRYDTSNNNPYVKINATTGLPLTQYDLNMRRKVEILKYDKSSNVSLTKKQSWTQIVKGASQRRTYSQSQLLALRNGTGTENAADDACQTLSTSAGIPGAAFYLKLDPNVPLYNYLISDNYATRNVENTVTWTYTNNSDVIGNDPFLFTIFVGPAIDVNYGIFTFSAPIGLRVSGTSSSLDASGTFSVTIPKENISVSVSYGGKNITLNTNPIITFDTEITGKTVNGSFNGQIYIGQFVVSNLGLYLSPGFVYEISIRYIMINSYRNIDTFTSTMITGIKNSFTNSNKKTESRMTFTTAPASSSIDSFLLSRQ
jgi:hypothetical protein